MESSWGNAKSPAAWSSTPSAVPIGRRTARAPRWQAARRPFRMTVLPLLLTGMRMKIATSLTLIAAAASLVASAARADDGERLLTVDHYVMTKSIVPAIKGQPAEIYVRERAKGSTVTRGTAADRVVVFIHGAGTP